MNGKTAKKFRVFAKFTTKLGELPHNEVEVKHGGTVRYIDKSYKGIVRQLKKIYYTNKAKGKDIIGGEGLGNK